MTILKHHNPPGLHSNPAYTQAVEVPPGASIVFIGGQNGTDQTGEVLSDDIGTQTTQALENVRLAVEVAGGTVADIAKWTILLTDPNNVRAGFAAFSDFWNPDDQAPAITVQVVASLAHPTFLVEIEAIAAISR